MNTIHVGDAVTEMRKLPAETFGVIVTSPPYNLKNSTGNGMKDGRGGKWKNAALARARIDQLTTELREYCTRQALTPP